MEPFSRLSYTGSTPGTDSNTYVLFSTITQGTGNYFANTGARKFCLNLKHSHLGTLNAYQSSDGGTTWRQISTEAIAAPSATASTQREWLVAGAQDWKLEWVNGGTAQSPWIVDMTTSPFDVVGAGLSGSAGGMHFDATGNLKVVEQQAAASEDNTNGVIAVAQKPTAVSTYTWSNIFVTALATKLIVKASPGVIRSVSGRIDTAATTAAYYLQLWNLTDVPADATAVSAGNSLMAPVKIQHTSGTDDFFSLDFTQNGVYGSAGIVLGVSTTEFTKTVIGTSWLSATAEYI